MEHDEAPLPLLYVPLMQRVHTGYPLDLSVNLPAGQGETLKGTEVPQKLGLHESHKVKEYMPVAKLEGRTKKLVPTAVVMG